MTKSTCHSRNTLLCSTLPKAPSLWACLEFVVETPNFFSSRLQRDIRIVRRGPAVLLVARMADRPNPPALRLSSVVAMCVPVPFSPAVVSREGRGNRQLLPGWRESRYLSPIARISEAVYFGLKGII